MRENRTYGSEGGEALRLPDPYRAPQCYRGRMPLLVRLRRRPISTVQVRVRASQKPCNRKKLHLS